jgi:polyhydroxybutyrate depolymerase
MAVMGRRRLALTACALTAAACSRADLAVITRGPGDGGGADGGGADSVTPVTCPSTVLASGDTMQTVQVGNVERSYLLHVPPLYDGSKPVPLLLDFSGLAVSGSFERMRSPYPDETDPDGAIMAFPTGLPGPSGNAWNVGPCCVNADDVGFSRAMVAQVEMIACIDPKRVYATGFSMGGGMAHYLACRAVDQFAGVAPSAFDLLQENVGDCQPPRPITVISFRGTADNLVPYDGGFSSVVQGMPVTFLGAQATFQKWAEIDGCSGAPSVPDANGCSSYSTCQGGVQVVLCSAQGGGQAWGDATNARPVLKRHPLP